MQAFSPDTPPWFSSGSGFVPVFLCTLGVTPVGSLRMQRVYFIVEGEEVSIHMNWNDILSRTTTSKSWMVV